MAVTIGGCDFPGVVQSEGEDDLGGSLWSGQTLSMGGGRQCWAETRKDSCGDHTRGEPLRRCFQDRQRSNQCSHRL